MSEPAQQATPVRDAGLDWVRVTGLLLMAGIHFFKVLPEPGPASRALHFAGEGAAGFFFFAFGMTAARYHAKSLEDKVASTLPFLYVALAHNLYLWHRLDGVDFLFFLLLWRLILDAIAVGFAKPQRVAAGIGLAVAGALLAVRDTTGLNRLFLTSITGFFTLLPWGLFVLGGFLYAYWRPGPRRALPLAAGLVALAIACNALSVPLHRPSLALEKWPLRTPYVLFFGGLCMALVEGVNLAGSRRPGAGPPRAPRAIRLLSDHLLLATALHYLGVEFLRWLAPRWALLRPAPQAEGEVVLAILVSWAIALLLLFALVPSASALWRRIGSRRLPAALRLRSAFVAIAVLLAVSLCNAKPAAKFFGSGGHPGLPQGLALAALVYFALEADRARPRVRAALMG